MPVVTWIQRLPYPELCRGDAGLLNSWIAGRQTGSLRICLFFIVLGCGAYGFTVGLWRGWEMAAEVRMNIDIQGDRAIGQARSPGGRNWGKTLA